MAITDKLIMVKAILSNPQIIRVDTSVIMFLLKYMQNFSPVNVGGYPIVHSHLPALGSKSFSRFTAEHLLTGIEGPSHAQIGITNTCPQNCSYCYSKIKTGKVMDTETIKRVIKDLKAMGVVWLGLTGGEPLLNKDIVEIVEAIGNDCAVKLFTGGYNLTRELASDLKEAGLFCVSVSLDHWQEEEHDRIRGLKGSFKTALKAIEIFQEIGGIHVGVSTVLSRELLNPNKLDELIGFLVKLGVDEAWISETKPAVPPLWNETTIISEEERNDLIKF